MMTSNSASLGGAVYVSRDDELGLNELGLVGQLPWFTLADCDILKNHAVDEVGNGYPGSS
jgi:hypothetical protein